jgi:hypothetical protein
LTQRKIAYGVIPPASDAECAARMEAVLEVDARPDEVRYPVWCMEEQPRQFLKESRQPIAGTKTHPRRGDDADERAGTASIFLCCAPRSGWRHVSVRARRTTGDWAQEVEELFRTRYASVAKGIGVSDNVHTHTTGAFYETFEPEKARALVRHWEFCHTPTHGRWLHRAENALRAMTRQGITGHRCATVEDIREDTTAWHDHRNARQRGVDWQCKVDDARVKLKSVYPKLEV